VRGGQTEKTGGFVCKDRESVWGGAERKHNAKRKRGRGRLGRISNVKVWGWEVTQLRRKGVGANHEKAPRKWKFGGLGNERAGRGE